MNLPTVITNDHGKVKLVVERSLFGRRRMDDLTDWMTVRELHAWLEVAQLAVSREMFPRVLP